MMNNDMGEEQTYLITLAGLLHDIGKFAQRAGWQRGTHTEVGGEFVSKFVPEPWRGDLYPVMGHHDRPLEGHATKVVALADRLSAAEREERGESGPRQLTSIFSRIGAWEESEATAFWPLRPLALSEETLFPGQAIPKEEEDRAYAALWEGFVAAVETLPTDDLPSYLEGLYYALQRFTWCVPGAYYRSLPDVSLFDHSRTTAAMAACLTGLDESALDAVLANRQSKDPLVLLVGGDLSGVQDFIYTITARGAAKGLRGRSFYLQLLTEAVARYILRELGLPITNLLYAGGGHLYLLAPLSAQVKLDEIRAEVSKKLLAHHGGDLYLALGHTSVSAADFSRERFGKKWRTVSQAMGRAKRQRFSELDDADLLVDKVFGPRGEGGDEEGECQVCHYDGEVETENKGTEDERRVCHLCQSLEEVGTDLRDAECLLLGKIEPVDSERGTYADALAAFGLAVGLTAGDGQPVLHLANEARRATLLAMHDLPGVGALAQHIAERLGCPVAPGARYTVNVTPRKGDGVATFEDLQEASRGVKRLGVLRMDVDDLGDLFGSHGMKDATISRVASLSFALSLFFEGRVGHLCRRVNEQAENDVTYAIYSGGDDLFIVGAWDALPGLADGIRRELVRFAAGNPGVHISGGLTLHGGKYPLYQAAHDAESALDAAKDWTRPDGHNKDALNFLGLTIPWEDFEDLQKEQKRLVNLTTATEEGGLGANRALLRTLIRLYSRFAESFHERQKPYWGPWMWQGAYFLKRMEDRSKGEAQSEIGRIREALKENNFRYIETLGPAARWAELLTRKEREK